MKSRLNTLKVLLDTSFLLPTLGIDVSREVLECLKRLVEEEVELYYSKFSILESLWIAIRLAKDRNLDMERFNEGLRSIVNGGRYMRVEESSEVFNEALRLYMLGHKDMIDNILYATSSSLDFRLLTLDGELKEFIRGKGLKDIVLLPREVI
ncbi:PIN domain-containing protein [Candidatus Bathyarchaeota archaeon]|nr:PIN domain-containing protein [Candidatus Bathyarchaeota archaeon]